MELLYDRIKQLKVNSLDLLKCRNIFKIVGYVFIKGGNIYFKYLKVHNN